MSLLHLVQQHHRVGLAPHRLGQVAALLVAHVARGRADQARNRVFLHELGHVEAHDGLFGVEQEAGQGLGQLRLAHARGAEEQEGTVGPAGVGQAGTTAADGIGHGLEGLVLAHHPLCQRILQAQQLVALALQHLGHWDAGPLGDDFRDLLVGDLGDQQLHVLHLGLGGHVELLLQLGDAAVLQFRGARQVAGAMRGFQFLACLLQGLLDVVAALHGGLLRLPDLVQVGELALQALDLGLQGVEALPGGLVGLLLDGLALDLELDHAPFQAVHDLGLGIDLHADARGGLVDQVDGLVGQLAVGDVAVRQGGGGDDGRVGDVHGVVDLVAFLQAAQDGDGVLDTGLVHQHLLEAPFQGGVLLHVLAVLVQGGGAHAVQLTARQGGLEHVAGIHGALGLAGAHHGVQFVDEQDDLPFLLGKIIQHGLEAFLELAAELGAGDQRSHVQGQQALALEAFRHLAIDDALGQALDDGGLAHTGLADQHRVVLGAALQHLDGAADLVVTADDGVELALLGALGEVDGVFLQGLARLLGIGVIHRCAAAQLVDGLLDQGLAGAGLAQQLAQRALVLHRRQHEQLRGDVLVVALLSQLVGEIEDAGEVGGDVYVATSALHLGHLVQLFAQLGAQQVHVHIGLLQQVARGAALLVEQGHHDVGRLDVHMVAAQGQALGVGQGGLELAGQFFHAHAV